MDNKKLLELSVQEMMTLAYIWGGDDPVEGFDCSGLCLEFLWSQGLGPEYDTNAQGIHNYWRDRGKVYQPLAQFGSLCFYGTGFHRITHVGMALNEMLMIEAGGGGRKTNDKKAAIRQNAYVRIRPIYRRSDFLAALTPSWTWITN